MPARPISLFSDLPPDTPPLSPSRSPSSTSATRSSAASSNSSISLGDLGTCMSKTRIEPPIPYGSTEHVGSQGFFRKIPHENLMFNGIRERDIQEEGDVDMEPNVPSQQDRGRSGYDNHYSYEQNAINSRPPMPRQSSYSKRHSSFDTPREIPYPYGYLTSSRKSAPSLPSREVQQEASSTGAGGSEAPEVSSESRTETFGDHALNESSNGRIEDLPPPRRSNAERSSSAASLPLPSSMPYSSLPPITSPESPPPYENPRPAPMVPNAPAKPSVSSHWPFPHKRSILKTESSPHFSTYSRPPPQSPSPPLLEEEPDAADHDPTSWPHSPSEFDSRSHSSLPLPTKYPSHVSSLSSRPTSLPNPPNTSAFFSRSHLGNTSLPPPQPPTILTPPPPLSADEESSRKPAPYEPFLPREQLPADHTYIAVETVPSEYRLIVRLPGFQRDSITLAMRRRRILHVVADNWSDGGGHFERRISFGYDADLASVRAEFDGEILRIIVPRRTFFGCYSQPTA